MFNLDKFIADSVTFRPVSMFAADIEANKEKLAGDRNLSLVTLSMNFPIILSEATILSHPV